MRVDFPTDPKALMDENIAAELTGLSVTSLRTMRVRGGGPPFAKLGASVRYRRGDVDAWVEQRLTESTTGEGRRR